LTIHAGEQIARRRPFGALDDVEMALRLGTDRIGHALILGMTADQIEDLGYFKFRSKGAMTKERFEARRQELLHRARALGVVVELNLTSNQAISNLALSMHAAKLLVAEGVRVSVNTDDETLLHTTVADELHRFAQVHGVAFEHVVAAGLEAFASRMGTSDLGVAASRLRTEWGSAIGALPDATRHDVIRFLAMRFLGRPATEAALARGGDTEATLRALLHDVLRYTFH
jgi:hypothetical protein